MKKIIITICCLMATNALVFGQTAGVSKSDFQSKASQLTTSLKQGNVTEANASWGVVSKMMTAELSSFKPRMKNATNDAAKKNLGEMLQKQDIIYRNLVELQENIGQNKATIQAKLEEFAANMQ